MGMGMAYKRNYQDQLKFVNERLPSLIKEKTGFACEIDDAVASVIAQRRAFGEGVLWLEGSLAETADIRIRLVINLAQEKKPNSEQQSQTTTDD